jgi:hypothetical protein
MKKIFLILVITISLSGILFAQKTINDPNVEKRVLSGFHGIDVATGIKLYLSAGSAETVAVSADKEEFRDKIITEVVNGILKIHYETKPGAINHPHETKNMRAYVSYMNLDHLNASSGANVESEGVLKSGKLDMVINTGARMNAALDITDLAIKQSTGSQIILTGHANNLYAEGSTGSKLMGEELDVNTCTVIVRTGARISIDSEKEINARASSGGQVRYKGAAVIRDSHTSMGGRVTKI